MYSELRRDNEFCPHRDPTTVTLEVHYPDDDGQSPEINEKMHPAVAENSDLMGLVEGVKRILQKPDIKSLPETDLQDLAGFAAKVRADFPGTEIVIKNAELYPHTMQNLKKALKNRGVPEGPLSFIDEDRPGAVRHPNKPLNHDPRRFQGIAQLGR